jgi:hypothetical protein
LRPQIHEDDDMKILTPRDIEEKLAIGHKERLPSDGWADSCVVATKITEPSGAIYEDWWRYEVTLTMACTHRIQGVASRAPVIYDGIMQKSAVAIHRELYAGFGEELHQLAHAVGRGALTRDETYCALREIAGKFA